MSAPANRQPYSIGPARYAKGKLAIRASNGTGWKSPLENLAEALGGRWTHRDGAYLVSPASAKAFEAMAATGWHGSAGLFRDCPASFRHPIHGEQPRGAAVKLALKEAA